MSKTTINAPVKGYTGTTSIGPTTLTFKDGAAEHEGDLSDGARLYLEANGYGINTDAAEPEGTPEPADPREIGDGQVGTRLRDAAVDPEPEDFLAPSNAGDENPHGSKVVSPEIHASQGVRPVKPGPVHADDTEAQAIAESEHTTQVQEQGTVAAAVDAPAGNASKADWVAYAVAQGHQEGSLEELSRDEIRGLFDDTKK